ncbi:hypothetical protein PTTG_11957, partial [Puccinia triticina 1-1 BBBD Race 1]
MPVNAASGASCTINLRQRASAKPRRYISVPWQEYNHETTVDPMTGAIQEIVTIESPPASRFEIVFDIKPSAYSLICRPDSTATTGSQSPFPEEEEEDHVCNIYLDGIAVGTHHRHKLSSDVPKRRDKIFSDETTRYRWLEFANVKLVDLNDCSLKVVDPADKICEDEDVIKSLGTIRIDIFRSTLVYARRPRPPKYPGPPLVTTNQMKFSERSIKNCLSTTAGLSQQSIINHTPSDLTIVIKEIDPNPFLQFIFKYKPRSVLEAEGTIERPTIEVEVDRKHEEKSNEQTENENKPDQVEDDQFVREMLELSIYKTDLIASITDLALQTLIYIISLLTNLHTYPKYSPAPSLLWRIISFQVVLLHVQACFTASSASSVYISPSILSHVSLFLLQADLSI